MNLRTTLFDGEGHVAVAITWSSWSPLQPPPVGFRSMTFSAPTINRLREHLMELSTHSIPPQHGALRAEDESPEERALMRRFRPFAELFYLVAAADGEVDAEERMLILGAFRALTGGAVKSERLEELCTDLAELEESYGWEDRLEWVCSELARDRQDAELAFTLASAVALADDQVTEGEEELLMTLGDWLNIRDSRSKILIEENKGKAPASVRHVGDTLRRTATDPDRALR